MISEGADIIDIGAYSSRPGAAEVTLEEEISRIQMVAPELRKQFPNTVFSLDSFRSEVINQCAEQFSFIINDISGFEADEQMLATVKQLNFPYILMHMKGTPKNMQDNPQYEDVAMEVLDFLAQKLFQLASAGINQVIVDPGFGFGKSIDDNYRLLSKLNVFNILDKPILAGLSRKSMIYKLLGTTPKEIIHASSALNLLAIQNGAQILRVHDVKEAVETRKLWEQLNKVI